MLLRILTSDSKLVEELLLDELDKNTRSIELSADCSLKPLQQYQPHSKMVSGAEILQFAVSVTTDVGIGILSSCIYDKMKERNAKAEIDGEELPLSKEGIKAILIVIRRRKNVE